MIYTLIIMLAIGMISGLVMVILFLLEFEGFITYEVFARIMIWAADILACSIIGVLILCFIMLMHKVAI
jgi:hypothetical protein